MRRLAGYRRSRHRLPEESGAFAQKFVEHISSEDVEADLERIRRSLRKHMKLKRRELDVHGPAGGGGNILTPHFEYIVNVLHNPDRPQYVIWHRRLVGLTDNRIASSGAFDRALADTFTTLSLEADTEIEIEQVIDYLEDAEPAGVVLRHYPRSCEWCDLQLAGFDGTVRVEPTAIRIGKDRPTSPHSLLEAFRTVRTMLQSQSRKMLPDLP